MGAVVTTLVLATEWGVSTVNTYLADGSPGPFRLNVSRWDWSEPNAHGGHGVMYRHPQIDGLTFESRDAARCYAYNVGLLREYVSPTLRG